MKKITAIVLSGILTITAFAGNGQNVFAASKTKSPYTGITYTHKSLKGVNSIVHGIDVSKWNGDINWNKIKADGIDYAFIRCANRKCDTGVIEPDVYFKKNVEGAIKAGVKVGLYIFSQAVNEKEAVNEAKYIVNMARGYDITMPLVMDFEYLTPTTGRLAEAKLSNKQRTNICDAFLSYVDEQGYTPMLYANYSMLNDDLDNASLSNKYKIWLARYKNETCYKGDYDFWQYSSEGKVKGNGSSNMDVNFWYDDGSLKEKKVKADGVYISEIESNEIKVGESIKLNAYMVPDNTTESYRWTSSNPEIAYVTANGKVCGVIPGETTIKITTSKGLTTKQKIVVKDGIESYGISFDSKNGAYSYTGKEIKPSFSVRSKYKQVKKAKTKDNVYLRTGPDNTFIALTLIPKGKTVKVIGTTKKDGVKWYAVRYTTGGETYVGYTCAQYYKVKKEKYKYLDKNNYSTIFADNVEIGKATAIVEGSGKYAGQIKKSFTIGPKEVSNLVITKNTSKYIKLKFNAIEDVDGYEVYRSTKKNGKYKKVKTIVNKDKKTEGEIESPESEEINLPNSAGVNAAAKDKKEVVIKDTNVKKGCDYYYKITSYVNVDGNDFKSPYSKTIKGTCKLSKKTKVKLKYNCFIRKKANANSKALLLAYKGRTFKVISQKYDNLGRVWVRVRFKNNGKYKKGYILKSLVKIK